MTPIYIFGSGQRDPIDFYLSFLQQKAFIISIDGGANLLKELDLLPNLALGDFDSIEKDVYEWLESSPVEKLQYPREKDFSDFELTCQQIKKRFSPTQIDLFCMQGKRSDHFLFNLAMAEGLFDCGYQVIFHSPKEDIFFIDSSHPVKGTGNIGDIVSLVPCKNSVLIHQTTGLKYSLWEETLLRYSTRGLSNELIENEFEIDIAEGQAMMIYTRRNYCIDL
jgi:thiamine pyrophosphokinase